MPSRSTKYEGVHSHTRAATIRHVFKDSDISVTAFDIVKWLLRKISVRLKLIRGKKPNLGFVTSTTSLNQSVQNFFSKILSSRNLTFLLIL